MLCSVRGGGSLEDEAACRQARGHGHVAPRSLLGLRIWTDGPDSRPGWGEGAVMARVASWLDTKHQRVRDLGSAALLRALAPPRSGFRHISY